MYIRVINSKGTLTTYNLEALGIWRIEMMTFRHELGIAVRYFTNEKLQSGMIAAIDIQGDEGVKIVAKGFPFKDRDKTRDSFQESVKLLYNSDNIKPKDKDDIVQRALGLLDEYYKIIDALRVGAGISGEYEEYRYSITEQPTGYAEF